MILRLSQEPRGLVSLLSVFVLCALSARAGASDPGAIEAAKKEGGEIEAYVTLRTDTAQIIWKLFEARYPFLKVKQYKADSDKMLQRLVTEYRAKRYLVDVLNFGGGFHTQVLIEQGIAAPYVSPESKYFAPAFKDKNGFWTTLYYNPMTLSYNTKLIPTNERPREWSDLLNPKLKGKLAIEQEQVTWYAGMMKRLGTEKGKQFMQALSRQEPRSESSARGNALLAAGEFAAYIGRGHAAEILKKKGAPVEWIKNPDPLVVQPATLQLAKDPPHPNSARLLIDFMLSDQVAEVLARENRLPARSDAKGLDPVFREINADKILPLSLEEVQTNYKKYLDEFRNYFGK
jgi:iron(III) transport system substrate-binding protein